MELYDHFEGWVQNYCNSFTNVKKWQWFCTKPSIYNLTFCIILFLHIICHFVLFCMYVLFYVVTCPYGPWLIQINLETLKPTQWSPLAWRNANAKVNQKRKHEEINKYIHFVLEINPYKYSSHTLHLNPFLCS